MSDHDLAKAIALSLEEEAKAEAARQEYLNRAPRRAQSEKRMKSSTIIPVLEESAELKGAPDDVELFKGAPETASEEQDGLTVVESTVDLILFEEVPTGILILAVVVSIIQSAVFIVLWANIEFRIDHDIKVAEVIFSAAYAGFAISNEGYKTAINILISMFAVLAAKDVSLTRIGILHMEVLNFILLFFSTIFTCAADGSGVSMVLNCTVALAVSKLDEGLFEVLAFRLKKSARICEESDKFKRKLQKMRLLTLLYFFGVILVFFYIVGSVVSFANTTPPPTFMPTAAPWL